MNQIQTAGGTARGLDSLHFRPGTMRSRMAGAGLALTLLFTVGLEQAFGAGLAPLVFLGDKDYPPVAYLDQGVPTGMDVDLAKALAAVMKREVRVELTDWNVAQEKVLKGEADGLLGLSISEERLRSFDFADPTFIREFVLVVRSGDLTIHGLNDLNAKRVGVTAGGFPRNFLEARPGLNLIPINHYRDGLNRLADGTIDVMAADRWVAAYLIEKRGVPGVMMTKKPFATARCAIAVRKGNSALLTEINQAIHTVKANGKLAEIQDYWRPQEILFVTRERVRNAIAITVGIFLVTLLGVMGLWIRTLRRQARERRRVEQELRWRTAFFEAQVHSAIDGILVVDSEGRKILQNQRMTDLWKIPPHIAADPDGARQVQFVLGRVKSPQPFAEKVAYLYAHPDETSVDEIELVDGTILERYSAPVCGSDGIHYGRVWTFHDITGRKQADTALRQSEERFSRMVASSPIPIALSRMDSGAFLDVNESFLQMTGFTRAETIGRTALDLQLYPDPAGREFIREQLREHGHLHGHEQQIRSKSGEIRQMVFWCDVISIGGEQCVLVLALDMTERKRLEQQFLRAQRMESIGTLAGGIAHDLNNTLGPIIMSLDLLKLRFPDPASLELLDIINLSAQRGADMVRQVLSFARGVEGRRMEVQIKHLVDEIEKIANDTFLKHIQVRTNVPRDLWTVLGDPTQLHQVLLNLCVNARDAMPDGGVLKISAENRTFDEQYAGLHLEARPGPYVFIQVEDSGTGMAPETIDKIFDPFFTTKELDKGTGLGLSTSLGIVKNHGGFLEVSSELEKGTNFKIYLPAQLEPLAAPVPGAAVAAPCGDGELILLVDDEASVRRITQQTLQAFGYAVLLAGDGAEAVALYALRGAEIAVVLTDMTMPVMDGIATIQVLRRMNPAVRIIGTSGLAASGYASQAAILGVKHFLPKPYTAEVMLKTLQNILSGE